MRQPSEPRLRALCQMPDRIPLNQQVQEVRLARMQHRMPHPVQHRCHIHPCWWKGQLAAAAAAAASPEEAVLRLLWVRGPCSWPTGRRPRGRTPPSRWPARVEEAEIPLGRWCSRKGPGWARRRRRWARRPQAERPAAAPRASLTSGASAFLRWCLRDTSASTGRLPCAFGAASQLLGWGATL